ncbi:hypothetical protein L1987_40922 [Smallanthus sonchifolius]|uniref:Uncharacterized protein n=1 Tax=Smallanthus sonchifolius TaxID=185202 RepID=A0ACB9GUV9_9ASTR|nr:hypothetical protein L1987_40922 [Smallanthus sonchifolius]
MEPQFNPNAIVYPPHLIQRNTTNKHQGTTLFHTKLLFKQLSCDQGKKLKGKEETHQVKEKLMQRLGV